MNDLYLLQEDHGEYLTLDEVRKELSKLTDEEINSCKKLQEYDIIFCYQVILGGPNNGKYKRRHAIVVNPRTKHKFNATDIIPITSSIDETNDSLFEQCKIKIVDAKNAGLSSNKDLYMSLYNLYENTAYGKPLRYVTKGFIAKKVGHLQENDIEQIQQYHYKWSLRKNTHFLLDNISQV